MKLTQAQLRALVLEAVVGRIDEADMRHAKAQAPLKTLRLKLTAAKESLGKSGAKRAISDLYQSAPNADVSETARQLFNAVSRLETNIDTLLAWVNDAYSSLEK